MRKRPGSNILPKSDVERSADYRRRKKKEKQEISQSKSNAEKCADYRRRKKMKELSQSVEEVKDREDPFIFQCPSQLEILDAANSLFIDLEHYRVTGCSVCSTRCLPGDLHKKEYTSEYLLSFNSDLKLNLSNGSIRVCKKCMKTLIQKNIPKFSLTNCDFGDIPIELSSLTFLEQLLVCRYRSSAFVIKLYCGGMQRHLLQRAIKGNVIAFPNQVDKIARCFSLPQLETIQDVLVLIVNGTKRDVSSEIKKFGTVRKSKVIAALEWKKQNDPRYADVDIDFAALSSLEENSVALPDSAIQEVFENDDEFKTRINSRELNENNQENILESKEREHLERVGYVDINGNCIDFSDLWNASWDKTFLHVGRGSSPVSEYQVDYFYGSFPTLFPYGVGIPEDINNNVESLEKFLGYCLHHVDSRFRQHHSFIFVGYNIKRRRAIARSARLLVDSSRYDQVVGAITKLSTNPLMSMEDGSDMSNLFKDSEFQKLLHGLKVLTSCQDGTIGSKMFRRNELRSLIASKGIPFLWMTLNPNDLKDPLVAVLAGHSVEEALNMESFDRIKLVTEDPVAAVEHFHIIITTVLEQLFQTKSPDTRSIFGKISSYFGMIETQSRGTLHLHILLWSDEIPQGSEFLECLQRASFRDSLV